MCNFKDSLGDRMKQYENISRYHLTKKLPVIIRLDGKAFHSFTRGFKRPFDESLIITMQGTAKYLCENIMGCKIAYTQSDEISLLLVDYERIESEPWFDNNLQKITSVSASMATMVFNKFFANVVKKSCYSIPRLSDDSFSRDEYTQYVTYERALDKGAMFDARAFTLPKEEVCNYFIWRQQDATRNSIQMVAQANFSHNELEHKNCDMLQEMLHELRGINWNDFDTICKRGCCIKKESLIGDNTSRTRWVIDRDIPIFTQDRNYIDQYVFEGERN